LPVKQGENTDEWIFAHKAFLKAPVHMNTFLAICSSTEWIWEETGYSYLPLSISEIDAENQTAVSAPVAEQGAELSSLLLLTPSIPHLSLAVYQFILTAAIWVAGKQFRVLGLPSYVKRHLNPIPGRHWLFML